MRPISDSLRVSSHVFRWLVCLRMIVVVAVCVLSLGGGNLATAQPPGTSPPAKVFEKSDRGDVPFKAFIFLDESKNPVLRPGTTWEEFEQVMDQIAGRGLGGQRFVYRSLTLKGDASRTRAQFEIDLEIDLEATSGAWVSVPLKLSSMFLTTDPIVRGIGEHQVIVDPSGDGFLLKAKMSQRGLIRVHLEAVGNVNVAGGDENGDHSLDLDLPPVPTLVELTLADSFTLDDVNHAEVFGRGGEVVRRQMKPHPMIIVESNGLAQTIRWGKATASKTRFDLIEVDTEMEIRWDSPQDQPIGSVSMAIRNLRGAVDEVAVWLPGDAIALDLPRLGRDGLTLDWQALKGPPLDVQDVGIGSMGHDWSDGQWFLVEIPEQEQQQRISLDFELQLSGGGKIDDPLVMRVPRIQGAIRHRGEITLTTSSDYHLRWRRASYVNRVAGVDGTLTAPMGRRSDRFQFDRQEFKLPLWLASQEREIRMSSAATMTIRNGSADLEMQIRLSGAPPEGRVQLSDAGWDILAVADGSNDQTLESFRTETGRTIEVGGEVGGGPMTIRLSGQRPLATDWGQVAIPIPSVSLDGESPGGGPSTLDIVGVGRTRLVVDLTATEGLTRVGTGGGPNSTAQETSRFRVNSRQAPAVIIGELVDQPPRISVVAGVTIELDGQSVATDMFWSVRSPMDLEGRLPIRFSAAASPEGEDDEDVVWDLDQDVDDLTESWAVTVDGVPALLQATETGGYDVVSERLSSGTFTIDFRHIHLLPSLGRPKSDLPFAINGSAELTDSLSLPRPNISDVTLDRPISITLSGNERFELSTKGETNDGELTLARFPIEPLSLRFRERTTRSDDLNIENVVLRTVTAPRIRHEHLIAKVSGASQIRFDLRRWNGAGFDPAPVRDSERSSADSAEIGASELFLSDWNSGLSVEAKLDGVSLEVTQDISGLVIELPADSVKHDLDLKIWQTHPPSSLYQTISPMLLPPRESGRIRWQVITPSHAHSVWSSPALSSLMSWKLIRWCLQREAIVSDARLIPLPNVENSVGFEGNRYLYAGIDTASFSILTIPRSLIWLIVAVIVLTVALTARSIPSVHHPMLAVAAALGLVGLLVLAPDAAVMAGQVSLVSLVLVVVMLTVRSLIQGELVVLPTSAASKQVAPSEIARNGGPARDGESGGKGMSGHGDSEDPGNTLTTTALGHAPGGSSRAQARGL